MKQRALVDIRAVLDTRLGVLSRMNPLAANKIVRSEWYYARDRDRFATVSDGVICDETFQQITDKYEVDTLVNSLLTDLLYILRTDIEEIFPQMKMKGLDSQIYYDINVYPFSLLDSEKEIIRRSIARYLTEPAVVKVVDLDYVHLHPATLIDNYEMMVMYNYEDWLRHHQEALFKHPIREFTIFYPRIAPSGDVPKPDEVFNDPFMVAPLTVSEHLTLHPVPTSWMSWNPEVYDRLISLSDKDPG